MGFWLLLLLGLCLSVAGLWYWRTKSRIETLPAFARTESDNSAEALYQQGMAYRRGQDLDLDFQAARRLLHLAARQHHAEAQYEYGSMLCRGLGGAQDRSRGLRWMQHAARGGCVAARFYLGQCYHAGDGVAKDLLRAERYLRSAAESGLADAQLALGLLYRDGFASPADPVAAAEWLQKAVDQRLAAAYFPLSELYERGLGVARDLKKADELLLLAAEFGDPQGQLKIARYYLTCPVGHEFKQDYRQATAWFRRAASHGNAEAEYELGVRYEQNEGVDAPSMSMAIASYLKAATAGYAPAQCRLGQIYLYGQGVNQNLREARRWFEAAAADDAMAADYARRLQGHVTDLPSGRTKPWDASVNQEPDWKG